VDFGRFVADVASRYSAQVVLATLGLLRKSA
jgi:hypothetical protein